MPLYEMSLPQKEKYPVLAAAVAGYGLTYAYSTLNPVGGAILFASFVYGEGLKSEIFTTRNRSFGRVVNSVIIKDDNLRFACNKIKACVLAWSSAYYVTPYVNLASVKNVFAAVFNVISVVSTDPAKIASLVSLVASKAFASLLAIPSQMYTSTAFVINSTNLPAVAVTFAVFVVFVSVFCLWKHLETTSKKQGEKFELKTDAKITALEADMI